MAVAVSLPVWRPECSGNGRLLLIGDVLPTSDEIDAIQWRVNGSPWVTGASSLDAPSKFSFWTYGQSPLPGTEVSPQWQDMGGYYEAVVYRPVEYITRVGALVANVAFGSVASTLGSWAQSGDTIRYRPVDGVAPSDDVVLVIAPAFDDGQTYTLEVRADVSGSYTTLASETFTWTLPTRDVSGHMMDVVAPSYVGQMQTARDLMYAQGRAIGDVYSAFDDYLQQSYPERATWALPVWESFFDVPTIEGATTQRRRAALAEIVRGQRGFRTALFQSIDAASGAQGTSIVDTYGNYRVDIRLPLSGTDPAAATTRAAAESVISRLKPAGIEVVVSYASFIAGVSTAGDPV